MSFYCEHCHFKNNEIQSAGEIQTLGSKYSLTIDRLADLARQVVKSDTAVFRIEDLDLEVPAGRGRITNVEGVITEILEGLECDQTYRKQEDPELYRKIDDIIQILSKMIAGTRIPYTISLDDPAGNSWIEPSPLDTGTKYTRAQYPRTPEQNTSLGLGATPETTGVANTPAPSGEGTIQGSGATNNINPVEIPSDGTLDDMEILDGHMYSLPCHCPGCAKDAKMNLQMVNIPYFKQVIISAVVCSHCGYRTSDVKTGGDIPEKGKRIWLDVQGPADLRRDILKSETCCLKVPACDVEVQPGTMGGRFTTVEGLLTQIREDLHGSIYDVDDVKSSGGDSMPTDSKGAWKHFFTTLDKAIEGQMTYTILLEDPLASSYVQSLTAPEPDPQIRSEEYIRSGEEEEDLGIADMRTQLDKNGEYVR